MKVEISHPEKVLFPDDGVTKGDVAAYYETVATVMLPHIRGRPVTMERYPGGIQHQGFMQKNTEKGVPDWVPRVELPKKGGSVHYLVVDSVDVIMWTANQNCITHHVWTSRVESLEHPDVVVFDLDPASEDDALVRSVAIALRDFLDELGLPSWVKTTGSKGFHIVVPLNGEATYDEVMSFADAAGTAFVARDPDRLTMEFSKEARQGRLFVDTGRNAMGATFSAAYTLRARPGAPASAPVTWEEIEQGSVGPRSISLRDMPARLESVGDLWSDMSRRRRSLARAAAKLDRFRVG